MSELFGDSIDDEQPAIHHGGARIDFRTPLGDEYPKCPAEYIDKGKLVANSMVGKDHTESICSHLRSFGIRVDWHFIETRILVKTMEDDAEHVKDLWEQELEQRGLIR